MFSGEFRITDCPFKENRAPEGYLFLGSGDGIVEIERCEARIPHQFLHFTPL